MAFGNSSMMAHYLAVGLVFMIFFLILFLALYLYVSFAIMAMAKKTNTPNGWMAFMPIANVILLLQIAKLPWWYVFGFLLGFIPFLGILILIAGGIYLWWKVAEAVGKPGWWGILSIIPIVNLVIWGVMAWGK